MSRMQVAPCGGSAGLWLSLAGLGHAAASVHRTAHSTCDTQASLMPLGAPHLSCCKARWGPGGRSAQIHTYILTHAGHVCTHNHTESLTVTCTLWTKAHSSPCVTMATQQAQTCTPRHCPWLIELPPPISCPPVRQGAGRDRGGTAGRCQCPWSHRGHSLPGSDHRSCLLPGT